MIIMIVVVIKAVIILIIIASKNTVFNNFEVHTEIIQIIILMVALVIK